MTKLLDKVFDYIKEQGMLQPGDRVVAGVSGGADSVCLLLVLAEWKRRYPMELTVVHVHHGIRPEAADDARFVESLCGRYNIPYVLEKADVPALAAEWGCGEEEAGRRFRYEAFERAAVQYGADRIAVAHNLNDLSETMLFHLFRGSGIKGLAGIPAVRGKVIRPLLCVERSEIEAYLKELGQDFCRDHTNEEDAYTRNRIRHHILPYVEEHIVSGCVRHMGRTAELLAETEDYLAEQTAQAMAACAEEICAPADAMPGVLEGAVSRQAYIVDCDVFLLLHPAIRKRLLYELIKALSPGAKDITSVHVDALLELLAREGNREIHLPFGIRAVREYGKVRVMSGAWQQEGSVHPDQRVEFQILSRQDVLSGEEKNLIFPQNEYTKWVDYDNIKKYPIMRTRAEGDFLTIRDGAGALCHKKLKDYLVDAKIPARERDRIPVLAEDSHVLWLVGYRISEYYKVTEQTERILQVQIETLQKQ